ncbi:MAG: hypothetical protein ACYTEK_21690 [Planctomycetota bacterium]|jgi:hypothetical protein
MNIIALAFDMAAAVKEFVERAKRFYYHVMLFGCRCGKCNGSLTMISDGRCRCDACGDQFDPTAAFQRCSHCGGTPVLKVRRYACRSCGQPINSVFLFDGIVFDARYFKQKMAESRRRKKDLRQRVREMLADCRSVPLSLEAPDLNSIPGLIDALNSLGSGIAVPALMELKGRFDLNRYQNHIRACLETGPATLRRIPALIEDPRLDLIWRFIGVIFLEHAGLVTIRQQGQTIWVMKCDDGKGQDLPGGTQEADGFKRPERDR